MSRLVPTNPASPRLPCRVFSRRVQLSGAESCRVCLASDRPHPVRPHSGRYSPRLPSPRPALAVPSMPSARRAVPAFADLVPPRLAGMHPDQSRLPCLPCLADSRRVPPSLPYPCHGNSRQFAPAMPRLVVADLVLPSRPCPCLPCPCQFRPVPCQVLLRHISPLLSRPRPSRPRLPCLSHVKNRPSRSSGPGPRLPCQFAP